MTISIYQFVILLAPNFGGNVLFLHYLVNTVVANYSRSLERTGQFYTRNC